MTIKKHIVIQTPDQLSKIVDYLNLKKDIYYHCNITNIDFDKNCIRCFSPSSDSPQLLNVYHLYTPFVFTNQPPMIIVSGETGENDQILHTLKHHIATAISSSFLNSPQAL